jgi:hypothetical protein
MERFSVFINDLLIIELIVATLLAVNHVFLKYTLFDWMHYTGNLIKNNFLKFFNILVFATILLKTIVMFSNIKF